MEISLGANNNNNNNNNNNCIYLKHDLKVLAKLM